jgi:hypothetical protein
VSQTTTIGQSVGLSPAALYKSQPFQTYFEVPVAGGVLIAARWGRPSRPGATAGSHALNETEACVAAQEPARWLSRGSEPRSRGNARA